MSDAGSSNVEESSVLLRTLREQLLEKLWEKRRQSRKQGKTILDIFAKVEMPLIAILREMERIGVRLNGSILTTLSDGDGKEIEEIQKEIYTRRTRIQCKFAETTLGSALCRTEHSDGQSQAYKDERVDGVIRTRKS